MGRVVRLLDVLGWHDAELAGLYLLRVVVKVFVSLGGGPQETQAVPRAEGYGRLVDVELGGARVVMGFTSTVRVFWAIWC